MELIIFSFEKEYNISELVVAMGEFDGLHLAHQFLINKAISFSKEMNIKNAVVSFDPHPDFILKKRTDQGYITPLSVKAKSLEKLGVDYFIVIPFTVELSQISYRDYENLVLKRLNIKKIVVGFDYHYGFKGKGNAETLKDQFLVHVVDQIDFRNQKMGSNAVRQLLLDGRLDLVTEMLGRYYNITGKVEMGNQIGSKIGIRTANINLDENYQVLKKGVYGVIVKIDEKKYLGVCNIGNNPSFNYVEKPRLEVHILDFNEMIYQKIISVDFVAFLRDEKKYANSSELLIQIAQDIIDARKALEDI